MTRSSPALARRALEPTWLSHPVYVETFGPEVVDLNIAAGFVPDPEQAMILDLIFAIDHLGKSAAFEIDVVGPRQVMGKTGLIQMAELGWLYVTDERLVVHSAHELDTTGEAFRDLKNRIQDTPVLSKHLDPDVGKEPGITEGNGRWGIHLVNNRRIRFKARTVSGGRGLTGNKIVLDEAFALTPSHMGSLLPTLAAVPDPQLLTASSAGKLESVVLRERRDRGRAGTTRRQVYVEYADREQGGCKTKACNHALTAIGCALDDEKRWKKFMPALRSGRSTTETVQALRQAMPPDEFAREFMVWWEDPPNGDDGGAIDMLKWNRLADRTVKAPDRAAVYLDVAPNRQKASIGVAGTIQALDQRGQLHDKTLVMTNTSAGWEWVVPSLVKMLDKREVVEIALHPASQAQVLLPGLKEAGIEFVPITMTDVGRSTGSFIERVHTEASDVVHLAQAELDEAVKNAITRFTGEAEVWDRKDRTIDITALVAASGAADRWAMQDDYDTDDSYL